MTLKANNQISNDIFSGVLKNYQNDSANANITGKDILWSEWYYITS